MHCFSKKRGFTLVELIVVMAIATIIMTALVVQQSQWNDSLVVSTQAYELVLMIRQAQIYSLGVREDTAGTESDKFNIGYGVYIDINTPDRYIFFADRDSDEIYTSGDGQPIETKIFTRGVTIDRICGIHQGNSNPACSPWRQLSKIDISFFRPEPKANLSFIDDNNHTVNPLDPPVTIYLKSPGGKQYEISIEISGEISVTPVTP
jgi:prepilin-type N-terminal cleavage/methylation domain-containing protein